MKTVKITLACVFAFLFFSFAANAQNGSKTYVEGELLVKFRSGVTVGSIRAKNVEMGAQILENFADLGWQRVKLPEGLNLKKAIAAYEQMPEVEAVQPNFYYHLQAVPNDTQFGSLWGMTKISAPAAWDLTTGSSTVVVAVIDTGMKYTHEDLAANVWTNPGEINGNGIDDDGNGFIDDYYGWDFFYDDSDPYDEHGHGTHVAGTIGAVGNNGLGVAGVNWNVRIMPIKIYNSSGYGTTSTMLINAYNYIRMMKNRGVNIRVTNNSYSGCDEACGYDQATKDAIDALGEAGILNVFAAGNDSRNVETNPAYPASYTSPSILSVAASTSSDARAGFSNWGTTSVDLAAPGQGILSTVMSAANYGTMSGTSMAAPHVAGAAALLAAYNPELSPVSLKATLMNTVDVLPAWTTLAKSGGRLNIDRALRDQTVCSFSLSSDSLLVPTKGGVFTVSVTAPANCDYSVKSDSNWISVLSSDTLSGSGSVTFRVSVNPTITRTGTLTIAGQTLTVTQSRVN
jgi:Subtilisin-like serine proteases